jgi:hypothetical protein
MPTADVFMGEVLCSYCEAMTRHRISILDEIIERQSKSYPDGTHINYVCPECNTLTRSLVVPGAKIIQGMDLSKHPEDLKIVFVSLQCAGKGCESRVILLAPMKVEIPAEGD